MSNNDDKIKKYKKDERKKYIIIFAYIIVIILEILALFNVIDMLWGCILFLLVYLFKKLF